MVMMDDLFKPVFPVENLAHTVRQQYNQNERKINVSLFGFLMKP